MNRNKNFDNKLKGTCLIEIMANSTEDGNHSTIQEFFCTSGLGAAQKIFISALSLPLSISAFLENILIIVALNKVSSLHPPSKLLLGCLACTDLGVSLISHPLRTPYQMFPEHSKGCYYFKILFDTIGTIFCAVSLFTATVISVDRLLALLLGLRYRQVVTVRRAWTFVVTLWVFSTFIAIVVFYSYRIANGIACAVLLLCITISIFCYTKIYRTLRLQQAQVQDQVHQGQPNGGGILQNKARYKKTVSAALWVQGALLACYLPFGLVVGFISISGVNTPSLHFAWSLTASLVLFNSTLNPFLYCWKMREIRQAVKKTIRQFCCLSSYCFASHEATQ